MPMFVRTAMDIGALIRDRRRNAGLSQTELAGRIGTTQRWVSEIERGKSTAEIGLVLLALAALGIQLSVSSASFEMTTYVRDPDAEGGERIGNEKPDIVDDLDSILNR
jgi:y4mF family transcriptional regulator